MACELVVVVLDVDVDQEEVAHEGLRAEVGREEAAVRVRVEFADDLHLDFSRDELHEVFGVSDLRLDVDLVLPVVLLPEVSVLVRGDLEGPDQAQEVEVDLGDREVADFLGEEGLRFLLRTRGWPR